MNLRIQRSTLLKTFKISLASVLLVSVSACSWLSSKDNRYAPRPLVEFSPSLSVVAQWRVPTGGNAGIGFQPALVDNHVYAAGSDGTVGKYEVSTGRAVWRVNVNAKIAAGVGSDGVISAVVSPRGEVIALDDLGNVKWRVQASSDVNVPPVVTNGQVIVRSGDYRIQSFSSDDGHVLWSVQRPGPPLALRAFTEMLAMEPFLFSGLPGGKLVAVDLRTGVTALELPIAYPKGTSELERVADVVGSPDSDGRALCAAAYQGRITCIDLTNGGVLWSKEFSGAAGVAIGSGILVAPNSKGEVQAFDLVRGTQLWSMDVLRYRQLANPVVISSAVVIGDYQGYLHFLSISSGALIARLSTDGGAIVSRPIDVDNGVIVQTTKGSLIFARVGA